MRVVAGHDPARFDGVMAWPLREMFLAYLERMKEHALRTYELDVLVWANLAPYQKSKTDPPKLPAILKS